MLFGEICQEGKGMMTRRRVEVEEKKERERMTKIQNEACRRGVKRDRGRRRKSEDNKN